jgi:thiosulfate/3-mercaptopyruvate sulfurtransferase
MNYTVEKEWLLDHLKDENIRIVDCRYNLTATNEGYELYQKDHIPGAVYFHVSKDLSKPASEHGGRHPLPDLNDFAETLKNAGIDQDTVVIAYDQGAGSYASRLWWMLNYAGHTNVYVLNGGYSSWKEAGCPVDQEIPSYPKADFTPQVNKDIFASYEDVKKIVNEKNQDVILIDARDPKRFQGIEEPLDKKAGHIPGAINKLFTEVMENGSFKSDEELEKRFSDVDKNKDVIVYCGSGISATPNFIALKKAGYEKVKLYAGSFSDWVSYDENEVETGE